MLLNLNWWGEKARPKPSPLVLRDATPIDQLALLKEACDSLYPNKMTSEVAPSSASNVSAAASSTSHRVDPSLSSSFVSFMDRLFHSLLVNERSEAAQCKSIVLLSLYLNDKKYIFKI
jgi:hypothetical protein